jgi:GNAT superfamily N-acetyltransferase
MIHMESADSPEYIEIARQLFLKYSKSLGVDLCFQGFEQELAALPGTYSRPDGRLLLTFDGPDPIGCGALQPLGEATCEMKRLYLRPMARGKGLGRQMALALIDAAREIGYERLRLDTLPSMTGAMRLYRSLGFAEIAPYRVNPVPGAAFLELNLKRTGAKT